jgi:sugar (pentulose or hexulose) kinase
VIAWAKDTIFQGLDYDGIDALAMDCSSSDGVFFYPHLQGAGTPHNVPAFGAFTGIKLSTTKAELARAILEGIAMEIRINFESAEEAGIDVSKICVFGGGSKSIPLIQMIADVTGRTILSFATSEMGAFGAARLAAKAVGIDSFSLTADRKWEPDEKQSKRYNELYTRYQKNNELILKLEP